MNINTDAARAQMVKQQVRAWDVLDPAVLAVLEETPRERFVPKPYRSLAFADTNIPLADGQVMLTPQVTGRLLQALEISAHDRALVVGTGSGFLTACVARLAYHVTSIDSHADLVAEAGRKLAELEINNCDLLVQDVFEMTADEEFDVIAVTGSLPKYDPRFESWLKLGGRLFLIVGEAPIMAATRVRRAGIDEWIRESLFETVVPPLTNAPETERFTF